MTDCYNTYLFLALIIVIVVMFNIRSENMVPLSAKRCSLCKDCPCNVRPIDLPDKPILYYGSRDKYLSKKISPYNTFHMCSDSEFGYNAPDVPNKERNCWIGSA